MQYYGHQIHRGTSTFDYRISPRDFAHVVDECAPFFKKDDGKDGWRGGKLNPQDFALRFVRENRKLNKQRMPHVAGKLGEEIFKRWCKVYLGEHVDIDYSYKKYGDDQDFKIAGESIDLKLQAYPSRMVKVEQKKAIHDIYVFCVWDARRFKDYEPEDPEMVSLIGWSHGDDVRARRPGKSKFQNINNHFVPKDDLEPMSSLCVYLRRLMGKPPVVKRLMSHIKKNVEFEATKCVYSWDDMAEDDYQYFFGHPRRQK